MKIKNCIICKRTYKRNGGTNIAWQSSKYCSNICKAKGRTKNGFWLDKDGYQIKDVIVDGKRKHMRVHRLVMQEFLGRELQCDEQVHHRNNNRQDNRIENLELISSRSLHLTKYHSPRKFFYCTLKGCKKKHLAKGMCRNHYYQVYRGLSICL